MRKVVLFAKQVPMLLVVLITGLIMGLIWHSHQEVAQWLVAILVAISLFDTLRGMIDDVRHGHVGVDILAVVAILSTLAVKQYWASWAVVLMLYSGDAIEQYASKKAQNNLTLLVDAAPQVAHVIMGGQINNGAETPPKESDWHTVPVDQVALNDILVVKPGETVPVDGEMISHAATLDLSTINGEPMPRQVYEGSHIMSGSVNGSGAFLMRAQQLSRDSQYERILNLVRSAQNSRPAVVKTADLMAVPFTVVAFIIACMAWTISGDPTRFAQVLVLATPCPLLIAAPVAYMAGSGRLAKAGILIKTQDVIENLGRVSHVFFDKTGTLTLKRPRVTKVELAQDGYRGMSTHEILAAAGAVESYSVHILANGITDAGNRARKELSRDGRRSGIQYKASSIEEDPGNGIRGLVNGHQVQVGRLRFVSGDTSTKSAIFPTALEPDEMAAYVSIDGSLAARIVMKDIPRADAATTIRQLRSLGIERLSMVTGDKMESARIIADQVGIQDVHAGLFPEEKADLISKASSEKPNQEPWWDRWLSKFVGESVTKSITLMVGDGVNDAPVLAAADVGMAITDGTTTAASESAQAVIMNDDIASLPRSIVIARRTKKVMLEAVVLGLFLATVGMICAAFDLIPVVVGAFMQEAIDVVSILWALTALLNKD